MRRLAVATLIPVEADSLLDSWGGGGRRGHRGGARACRQGRRRRGGRDCGGSWSGAILLVDIEALSSTAVLGAVIFADRVALGDGRGYGTVAELVGAPTLAAVLKTDKLVVESGAGVDARRDCLDTASRHGVGEGPAVGGFGVAADAVVAVDARVHERTAGVGWKCRIKCRVGRE